MFTRAIRPSVNAARRVAIPAPRYTSQRTNDPDVLEKEKYKNLRGEQHSPHSNAPGWNEALASDSEAHIKADKATGTTPQEMASSTLEYMKKQHPDSWSDTIREHTNAPYIKDSVQGPLGALAQGAKKAANALAEAAATDHEDVQGNLSDKGAKAEQARRASLNTESEEAVRADRELRH
ncbi:hypothetical protein RSOLAG1IB_01755 [Rhizoctonia solani AG-1 IB]|uniref:Uncharacterized protein n=1 Tax=Thanatephorus cucumeris (strain AG1-IB / isolate 7/3/14) TaxID=1108050 RepID=A0A0B7FHQ2_THACB|nr:hypothetical protein RSOLAG1IB_01755 [Rhizoctonia solani AG-1 IB]